MAPPTTTTPTHRYFPLPSSRSSSTATDITHKRKHTALRPGEKNVRSYFGTPASDVRLLIRVHYLSTCLIFFIFYRVLIIFLLSSTFYSSALSSQLAMSTHTTHRNCSTEQGSAHSLFPNSLRVHVCNERVRGELSGPLSPSPFFSPLPGIPSGRSEIFFPCHLAQPTFPQIMYLDLALCLLWRCHPYLPS